MSDAIAASPAPAPAATSTTVKKAKATKPKGEKKPKTTPSHPVYSAMIKAAIKVVEDRKRASKQAILKYIVQKYKLGDNEKMINARLRFALKKGVESGFLKQMSGAGAAGRFRLAEEASEPKPKKTASKPKIPKRKKQRPSKSPKKTTKPRAKTAKSPKKPVAATTITSAAAVSTPKKAAASKPKSPKKAAGTKKAAATKA
ncbi:unnamed protein product [Heligmosomoides polygyrus]|uniref:H15 domain-containing protein n=1 Tax=Heligmosomoides polygyrus TaxID=6339 RepID=A0A183F938_HELPZ|nr:unnamed protein product [Heligmosomoides polygyrus]